MWIGVANPTPNSQPGGVGYHFSSGSPPLTRPDPSSSYATPAISRGTYFFFGGGARSLQCLVGLPASFVRLLFPWIWLCLSSKYSEFLCVFVRASLHMRREEKPTRCHWMVYCTHNMLNMVRALLCPSSGARDYMCVITASGVQCLVCWLSGVRCRTAGYASRKRYVVRLVQHPSSWRIAQPPTTSNQALHTIGGNNTHIVSTSWWWT